MVKRIVPFITIILILIVICSCATPSPTVESSEPVTFKEPVATVLVTGNFGHELVLERDIEIQSGDTALSLLQDAATIETKYGGGFISSINGISSEYGGGSSDKEDWFFYINGISANVGAGDYILSPGDVEHWDFHDWSYQQFIPAIVGDYPQPFLSGYANRVSRTIVVYEEPYSDEVETLVAKLVGDGVSQALAVRYDRLSEEDKQRGNLIIVAGPDNEMVEEIYVLHKKLGLYAYMESGEMILLDAAGNLSAAYGNDCGIIQATQNPWNGKGIGAGENVVWLVTGTDEDGVVNALNVLINDPDSWSRAFAVAVIGNQVLKIP